MRLHVSGAGDEHAVVPVRLDGFEAQTLAVVAHLAHATPEAAAAQLLGEVLRDRAGDPDVLEALRGLRRYRMETEHGLTVVEGGRS